MKNIIIVILLFCFISAIKAQKHDNVWLTGNSFFNSTTGTYARSHQLNFNQTPMQHDTIDRPMEMSFASASICDTAGNLMFYTNGIFINDHTHQLMDNGDSLGNTDYTNDRRASHFGCINSAGYIVLPHPDSSHLYYLLHQVLSNNGLNSSPGFAESLYYSLIDMNAKNGRGALRLKNQLLVSSNSNEKLDFGQLKAAKHANGKDWWVLQPLIDSVAFITLLIKGDSIIRKPNQSFHISKMNTEGGSLALFSPDATRYLINDVGYNKLVAYNFNRCTGRLSNRIHLNNNAILAPVSIAFSPNSRFLYVTNPFTFSYYQYDFAETNVVNSAILVGTLDTLCPQPTFPTSCTSVGFLQLAPDNKIYATGTLYFLHSIENPDIKGAACNFRGHNTTFPINLTNPAAPDITYSVWTFPNFAHYRTPAIPESECWTNEEEQGGEVISSVEETEAGVIKLYPNPARTAVYLQNSTVFVADTKVNVYNNLGQIAKTISVNNETNLLEISISELAAGIYTLQIVSETNPIVKSFVVIRQ